MRYTGFVLLGVVTGAGILLSFNGCGAGSTTTLISHVVVIVQENRTPDNLFQDPVLISRGADIAKSGVNSYGKTIQLAPVPLANRYDLDHQHIAFVQMYDNGKMDGADRIAIYCYPGAADCPAPDAQFSHVAASDVQPYYSLAEQYTFADRMFQTNEGPSYPAHQFIFSGTSAPTATSNLFVAENPPSNYTGCTAPVSETVAVIDPLGIESGWIYPCYEHPTLPDLLEGKGLTWRYYTPLPGSIWTAPNSIKHLCGPQNRNGRVECTASTWTQNVILSQTQVLRDVANRQLSNVSWVIPTGSASDHPGVTDGSGPSWVAQVVNAIGNSPYWSNTVILIAWDDWGGWYDHVPPPAVLKDCSQWGCGYVYGFRVPLIVVSPFAKPGYISHVQHDFGSILKFIEERFNLGSLGYADAPADDLSDCFDFSQVPLKFHTIVAPLDASYFLNDTRPATPPDDD